MSNINHKTRMSASRRLRHSTVVFFGAALIALPAVAVIADTPGEENLTQYEVEKQVSANAAKRLARSHLQAQGFNNRIGPGGAKIRSITRDAGTWIIYARVSNGTSVLSEQRVLYVDAQTGVVSDVPPETSPAQVASE